MELYQIRYFLAVCEYGGFSRAAESCGISQPALTTAIKKLEAELGADLFHREGKRLVLTELGCRMRPHLEQVLGETERAEEVARNFRLLRQAPLRIGTMATIGPVRIAAFLGHFRALHPGVELAVHELPLSALLRSLEAGELDLAMLSAPEGVGDVFRTELLYNESYVVVFPPGHAFEGMEQVRLQDTSGREYVDRLACELREALVAVSKDRRVELYAACRSDREDWVQSMVMAGMGFAFMPQYSITQPEVLTRPLVEPAIERAVVAAEVRGRARSPAAKLFFEALRSYRWADGRSASAPASADSVMA